MQKLALAAILFVFSFVAINSLHAQQQQFDAAFGVTTIEAPSASSATGNHATASLRGGGYPGFSADFVLKKHLGVQGEVAWRGHQGAYFGFQPYRPIFYDFNGFWTQRVRKIIGAEAMAGIGGESLRFYQSGYTCSFVSCTNYTSSNHFATHVGGGIRFYVVHNIFVRPEAHFYFVPNNNEFSSDKLTRIGASIGYTFAPGP